MLRRHAGAVSLTYHVDKSFGEPAFVITVDASPWGLGGYIEHRGKPLGWFTDRNQSHDVHMFGIKIGSDVSQTLLEALAVLVAVRCWSPLWKNSRATLRVRSDSLSTLGAVNRLRSKTSGLATVIKKLALDSAEEIYSSQILEHVPGEQKRLSGSTFSSLATRTNEQRPARPVEGYAISPSSEGCHMVETADGHHVIDVLCSVLAPLPEAQSW